MQANNYYCGFKPGFLLKEEPTNKLLKKTIKQEFLTSLPNKIWNVSIELDGTINDGYFDLN